MESRRQSGKGGKEARVTNSFLSKHTQYRRPRIARARRINQDPHLHSAANGIAQGLGKRHAGFIPIKYVSGKGDCVLGGFDGGQHGGIRCVSILQRDDLVAAEERAFGDPPDGVGQRAQMTGVLGQPL
jgi:hypothetical protein